MGVSLQSLTRLVRLLQREIVLTRSRLPPPVCASLHPCRVPTLITPCGIAPHRCIHTTATALAAKNVPPPPPPPSGNDRIALLDAEGADLGVMPRRRAQSLAESLADGVKLRLVLVSRGGRGATPRYQLMTGRQLMEERRRVRVIAKTLRHREPKTVRLASRIEPHDLDVKQRQISDWLRGGHDVTVSIRRLTGQDDRVRHTGTGSSIVVTCPALDRE